MKEKPRVIYYDVEVFVNFWCVTFIEKEDTKTIINDNKKVREYLSEGTIYLIGFNSLEYDNKILEAIFNNKSIHQISKISNEIVSNESVRSYANLPRNIRSIDLMRILQIGFVTKGLKSIAINLKWPLIQDMPIDISKPVEEEQIKTIVDYNINDVKITRELARRIKEEIELRFSISKEYGINVLNASRSMMGDSILESLFINKLSMTRYEINKLRDTAALNDLSVVKMSDVVSDSIEFSTDNMKKFLSKLKNRKVKQEEKFHERLRINDTYYDMKMGGLHSVNEPEIHQVSEDIELIDADVSSYYPSIIIKENIYPTHIGDKFVELVDQIRLERLEAKRNKVKNKSEALKITINSIFGKLGFRGSWLYDPLAMYKVTINGQLFLLMLIEELEENGVEVFYANTDGITCKVTKDKKDKFDEITTSWSDKTGMELEFKSILKTVIKDVNNFLVVTDSGCKAKGALDKDSLITPSVAAGLMKGYDAPIISLAIHNYFVNDISPEETIKNHTDILDFCIAQKSRRDYEITYTYIENGKINKEKIQKTNRYIVCKPRFGGSLTKSNGIRTEALVANYHLMVINDLDEFNRNYKMEDVLEYEYYIKEVKKIIELFNTKQLSLF